MLAKGGLQARGAHAGCAQARHARVTVCRAVVIAAPTVAEAFSAYVDTAELTEHSAKPTKCVHPNRPASAACLDCPRKKGRSVFAPLDVQDMHCSNLLFSKVFAAKSKCIHPTRPIKDACPDCPRRR
mmetsp:Transcript_4568/g.7817  ORF Transcript_4568/g.7817 Transcript_4568/m.7817 type:complete len:127 (+) Transcript_4568:86-466(+)